MKPRPASFFSLPESCALNTPWALGRRIYPSAKPATVSGAEPWQSCQAQCNAPTPLRGYEYNNKSERHTAGIGGQTIQKGRTPMKKTTLIAFSLLVFTGGLSAQGLTTAEKTFVKKAASGNLTEVELGKLASQKSDNSQVKAFGEQMVTDHSKANDNLKPIADSNGVQWPTELTGEGKTLYDRLSKLSGKAFDKVYIHAMVQGHETTAKMYEQESGKVKDSQLKSYVDQTLPVVQQHLKHIQSIQQSSGGSAQR
jgi:putative membrane protein